MRHFMVDPDNEERLLKVPPHVVRAIKFEALDAAREAIEAIPDGYKIRGEFESYSAYHEGRSDFKDGALSAIDALREKNG